MAKPYLWNRFLFDDAISHLQEQECKTVVEIGCIRDSHPDAPQSDGYSTLVFGNRGLRVTSVDLDLNAVRLARNTCLHLPNVNVIHADGLAYLKDMVEFEIGLLYLDGPDADQDGAEFAYGCYRAAQSHLAKDCLILIDDCDRNPKRWHGRGKGEKLIPILQAEGFATIKDNDRQVLVGRRG